MNIAYFYLTGEGKSLAEKLSSVHPGTLYGKENFKENLQNAFSSYDFLVCIMAAGIVVRILAPLIVHKTSDPGVVVMDQRGRYAISLLSGHLGGANDLAREMAFLSGGEAVITTATDVAGEISFDTFAKKHDMAIENIGQLKYISSALLEGKPIRVYTNKNYHELSAASQKGKIELIPISLAESPRIPSVVIHEGFTFPAEPNSTSSKAPVLYLRPRTIYAGIGCKRGMDQEPIECALRSVLKEEGLSPLSLKSICTIPLKADEPGILATAQSLKVPLSIVPTEEIEHLDMEALGIQSSGFVEKQTGVLSVSTASAYIASGEGSILRDKVKFKGITIALCQEKQG